MLRNIIAAVALAAASVASFAGGPVNWSVGLAGPGYAISTGTTYIAPMRNTFVAQVPMQNVRHHFDRVDYRQFRREREFRREQRDERRHGRDFGFEGRRGFEHARRVAHNWQEPRFNAGGYYYGR